MRRLTRPFALTGVATIAAGLLAGGTVIAPANAAGSSLRSRLVHAMYTEAFAYSAYNAYADGAQSAGRTQAADNWRSTADVEYWDHFVSEGQRTGLVKSNRANLDSAIAAEAGAIKSYAEWSRTARKEGCVQVAAAYDQIRQDEMSHHRLFVQARRNLAAGKPAPQGPAPTPVKIIQSKPSCSGRRTMHTLDLAMHSEALAWAKYTQWSEQAASRGYPSGAALFRSIARIEKDDHFATEANLSGFVGTVHRNLRTSIGDETSAIRMYTADIAAARSAHKPGIVSMLKGIRRDERGHRASFRAELP